MRKINKIKIYCNDNKKSNIALCKLKKMLLSYKFNIVENNPDLVIAIGGDGSFLRMIKKEEYNSDCFYVGINAGTLGFLQNIKVNDIKAFIEYLNNNKYKIDKVGVQETTIITDKKQSLIYSLNEMVIREKNLNVVYLKVNIKNTLLEKYAGDGLVISTSVGSTAYNLSFGGSIIYNTFNTIQITPIAPLNNKTYRNFLNSVIIPEKDEIRIQPFHRTTDLLISFDGENKVFNNVKYIGTKIDKKRLKILRLNNDNYWQKVNEKFLSV